MTSVEFLLNNYIFNLIWSKDKVLIKFMGADEVKDLSVIDMSVRAPASEATESLTQSLNLPGV